MAISKKGLRKKGNSFENEVATDLRQIGFIKAGRRLEFQKHKVTGVDLDDTGPFRFQCKSFKRFPSMSLIKEIQDQTGIPGLIAKANGHQPLIAIPWTTFLIMAEIYLRTMSKEKQKDHGWSDPREMDLGF